MAFSPDQHLRSLKGQQYLDVKWRLVWLRDEHPEARITTEMVHLDMEERLAVFRAEVTIPDGGSASGYGSETERDFPLGFIEKAETKAIGRALAALGFGTQFALELDEGDRVVDSPVLAPQALARSGRSDRAGLKVVAERPAEDKEDKVAARASGQDQDHAANLRDAVVAGLAADTDAAARLPKSTDEMTSDELEKTLAWLRNRAKRSS